MFTYHARLAVLAGLVIAGCESAPNPVATGGQDAARSTAVASSISSDYTFTAFDVPSELGAYTTVYGVNSSGTIVGNYGNVDGTVHGFLVRKGQYTDVTVPGSGGVFSGSLGPVNDLGDAAGIYSDNADVAHAFIYARDGTITLLPDPIVGAVDTDPTGLNNYGTIVGTCRDAAVHAHGFIRRNGSYELYDYPGAVSTRLNGINDHDVVVGQFSAGGVQHGFILENGNTQVLEFPGAVSTRAADINNRGDIVGYYNNSDGVFHGFVYRDGQFATLDFPGSSDSGAFGISNKGVIVGTYNDFSFGFVASPGHGSGHTHTEILAND